MAGPGFCEGKAFWKPFVLLDLGFRYAHPSFIQYLLNITLYPAHMKGQGLSISIITDHSNAM